MTRLKSTRSIFSGRDGRRRLAVDVGATSSTCRAAASGSSSRSAESTRPATGSLLQLERQRAGVDPRQLEQVVDEQRERPHLLAQRRQVVVRLVARPSSIASIIACIEASGVRRSWLAQATSSRRASKSCSMLAAIALNESASCAISLGAARRARAPTGRRRRARAEASPTRRIDCDDPAREQERRRRRPPWRSRRRRRGSSGRRPCGTSPSPRRARRRAARRPRRARARRAGATRSARRAARRRRASADARLAPATTSARPITGRAGSRRPRRSAGGAGGRGRPRASRAGGGCARSPCRCRAPAAWPQTRSMRWSREKTRRGFEARNQSRSNSRAVSVDRLARPRHLAARRRRATTSPNSSRSGRRRRAPSERRSTVRTRAASSRGENGFVT